ncbi:MAG TPA: molybdopterin-dependent oxidoreductase [Alloacidobacterium sp.]|nr:molybdopterin-dependent oxidoreductase [Alloacidobacterium sp.]
MRILGRSVFVAWILAFASLAVHAQASLKVENGRQQTSVSLDALKSLPRKTVTVHNPHENVDETYSGVPLIELLKQVGAPTGHDVHGKALSEYIVATGSDGYKAVLALAEAEPDFHPGDVLVADTMNGKPLDTKIGPFRLVVTEDKRPARSVRNLVSVELKAAE